MAKYINMEWTVRPNDSMSVMTVEEMLKRYTDGAPMNAVEICHCEECVYINAKILNGETIATYCTRTGFSDPVKSDDFCSKGRRRGR